MDDELDQLLDSLKLGRIREILDDHVTAVTTDGPSYTDFLRRNGSAPSGAAAATISAGGLDI